VDVDRRVVLQVTGIAAIGGVVAACSSSGSTASTAPASGGGAASGGAATGGAATGGASGTTLTKVADVPVGGGVINADAAVVVTQPQSGTIKAFSAICTHQGCLVGSVENNEIICPCHGSKFSATDGSVINGPAQQPLAAAPVTVSNGAVVLNG
jgi:nitrite reductase/ring-hydroxylating ferredoxin subunit